MNSVTAQPEVRDIEQQLRETVASAGAILHNQGLSDYLGHCSARVPGTDRVIVKAKHSNYTRNPERLTPADMVVMDLDGELLEGEEEPPGEYFIHTEIYRSRPDVLGVVHTHQPATTLLGILGREILPLLHVPAALTRGEQIPVWPCALLVKTLELGRALADTLGDASFCHLQGHGIVSVADDLRLAVIKAIALEQQAEANLRVLQTGLTPHVISDDELTTLTNTITPPDRRWAYYLQLLEGSGA